MPQPTERTLGNYATNELFISQINLLTLLFYKKP